MAHPEAFTMRTVWTDQALRKITYTQEQQAAIDAYVEVAPGNRSA